MALGLLGAVAVPPVHAVPADHLVFSEVAVLVQRTGSQFIEIVNPTATDLPLQEVAVTNGTNVANDAGYWRIAEGGAGSATAGGGTGGTFHGRFPDGYILAAGDTLVISVAGSNHYEAAYGRLPDFEIFEDAAAPDQVPELVEVFPGSIGGGLGGTGNNVELISISGALVLYTWDGVDDLVADLDYFHWGASTSFRVDKTGVTIGVGTYLDDTDLATQLGLRPSLAAGDGSSYARISDDEGAETTPGNGLTGHDETSEDLDATWAVGAQDPGTEPGTHHPAAPIVVDNGTLPTTPRDGDTVALSVSSVAPGNVTSVVFSYTVDGGATATVAGTDAGGGAWTADVSGQVEGAVVAWWAEITDSGGGLAMFPAGAPRFTTSYTVEAAPVAGEGPDKLLLTQVCTLGSAQEFVEIWNPNSWDVDLSDYYLTDAIYSPNNTGYWNIGGGVLNADAVGGGAFTDFHARFPDGFVIEAGDTITVTIPGTGSFAESYGYLPDLELYEDDLIPDAVPDMRWIFGTAGDNSILSSGSTPSLTNSGEPVIVYHYEPGADLVTDVDIFIWGGGGSYLFDKTGKTVGSSTYAADTSTGSQDLFTTQLEFGFAYRRDDANEGTQSPSGSNGIEGRDETSENWSTTFVMEEADPARPGGGETPGGGKSRVELLVPARTFLPTLGEIFPIRITVKSGSETRVRLFDGEGRHVITLFDSRFDGSPSSIPGIYTTVAWDGRDDRFELLPAGMYIVHLSVVDKESGDEETKVAPVVLATRLSK